MNRLEKIQQASGLLRYLLFVVCALIGIASFVTFFLPDRSWVVFGDGQFNELWQSGGNHRFALFVTTVPFVLILLLGFYWLQRLLAEYQAGQFFTQDNMRCYVWLVWLKAASFIYGIVWPLLLTKVVPSEIVMPNDVNIEVGTIIEIVVLLVLVHILKEAQQINEENKGFV